VTEETPQIPLAKMMIGNATLLSFVYVVLGLAIETVRRLRPIRWVENLAVALDALPARILELLGLLTRIHEWYAFGRLNPFWLRVIFGATTIVLIFAMAVFVGAGMWLMRRALRRRHAA
jgi:hypothetical protein